MHDQSILRCASRFSTSSGRAVWFTISYGRESSKQGSLCDETEAVGPVDGAHPSPAQPRGDRYVTTKQTRAGGGVPVGWGIGAQQIVTALSMNLG